MAKLPQKLKRNKNATSEELLLLDKKELVQRIIQLETHNTQLRNILSKSVAQESNNDVEKQKKFDFTKCHFRRILIHILYFGWDYQGLAVQEGTSETIEHHLFKALTKSCLIEKRETSHYHRCGRTDKGVSSFGQVISITVRSKFPPDQQNESTAGNEIQYCKLLNRLLPRDIRAVAWMPIPNDKPEYSARFDCKKRQYKYYFPKSNLKIDAMKQACSYIIGSHDFRHLCKMDVGNGVIEFRREIFNADILAVDKNDLEKPTSMYYLMIEGNAFLWHQIRCIMGVLLLIGQGNEEPDVMEQLLDISKHERKPQYNMALDLPLNLFHCSYDLDSKWVCERDELKYLISHLQSDWSVHCIKTTMIKDAILQLEQLYSKSEIGTTGMKETEEDAVTAYADCLLQGVKPRTYKPLLKRDTCSSLEERIEYYTKKRKITTNTSVNVQNECTNVQNEQHQLVSETGNVHSEQKQ